MEQHVKNATANEFFRKTLVLLVLILSILLQGCTQDSQEASFSEEELAQYRLVYNNDFVKVIRQGLDEYTGKKPSTGIVDNYAKQNMDKVDAEYFKNKFTVYHYEKIIAGGFYVDIVFQKRSDDIFRLWVYKTSDENWTIRSFEVMNISNEVMSELKTRFKAIINDPVYSM